MRAALTPGLPHMSLLIIVLALAVTLVGFGALAIKSFERRAIG